VGRSTPWANADVSTTAHQTIYDWVHNGGDLNGWATVQADLTAKGQAVQEHAVALSQAMNALVPHWKGKDALAAFNAIFPFTQAMHDMGGKVVQAAGTMSDVHAATVKVRAAVKPPKSMSIGEAAGAGGSGAAAGGVIAGPAGAVAGAVIGGVADYFSQRSQIDAEEQQARKDYKEFLTSTGKAAAAVPEINLTHEIKPGDLNFPAPPPQPPVGPPQPPVGKKATDSSRDSSNKSADTVNAMMGMSTLAGTGAIVAGNAQQPLAPSVPAPSTAVPGAATGQQGALASPVTGGVTGNGQQPVRSPMIGGAAADSLFGGSGGSISSRLNPGSGGGVVGAESGGGRAGGAGAAAKGAGANNPLGKGNATGAGAIAEEKMAARGTSAARGAAGANGAGGMGTAGAGSKKKDDEEHRTKDYLVGDHGFFANEEKTTPTVIGEADRNEENPHK
jgi:hypothetical protein